MAQSIHAEGFHHLNPSSFQTAAPTATASVTVQIKQDEEQRPPKKPRLSPPPTEDQSKLETRLGGILCCAVCLELPRAAIYQCNNGHLMCSGCYHHVLADARLKDEIGACPNCRIELTRNATRNRAVEKAISELPTECMHCKEKFPRTQLDYHETKLCGSRIVSCKYEMLGCDWSGEQKSVQVHESFCDFPNKSAIEVLSGVKKYCEKPAAEIQLMKKFISILSLDKFTTHDISLRPQRTEEYSHRLCYECARFSAFNNTQLHYSVNVRINDNSRDVHLTNDRKFSYQIIVKGKITNRFMLHYSIVKGPVGSLKVHPHFGSHEFNSKSNESGWTDLPLDGDHEFNRILTGINIDCRILMGLKVVGDLF